MTTGTISFSGLATSMDTKTIVSQLMAIERQPETLLSNRKTVLQGQVDVFNQLNSALGSLQNVVSSMASVASFSAKSAVAANSSVATVQATGTAVTGTHSLVVTQLATSQRQVSSSGYASASDLNFNTGTITITDDKGGSPITVTIGEGSNSLNGIAAAINASGANLTATVLNDGSTGTPNRLMVSGLDTKNYTLDFSGLTTPPASPNGAAYANPAFVQSGATYVAGTDASFTLDGVGMTRSSNTISDALPGVTLNLLEGAGATTTFTVSNDTATVTQNINKFVSSYNSAMSLIHQQSVYDPTTHTAGPLSGDSTIINLQMDLQRILSSPISGANGSIAIASQIGISTQTDGTLLLDNTKLSAALSSDFNGVVDLFTHNTNTSNLPSNQYGLAQQFNEELTQLTNPYIAPSYSGNGVIATRINSIQGQMSDIDSQIAQMEVLMTQKEDSLNQQFTAMETLVSSLQTQGNALLSALANYSASTPSK